MIKLNLPKFFKSIHTLSYALIKVDVPYMPKDFPLSYPNKDMDVIVVNNDFNCVKEAVENFCFEYSAEFEMAVITEGFSTRFRLNQKGVFHYQFDVSTRFFDLPTWWLNQSISEASYFRGYRVVPVEYEVVYRLVAFENKRRAWHLDYIKKNRMKANMCMLERLSLKELWNEYIR
ncbi:MAG: hypothetical protein ACTSWQ_09845 [Candidatus Thorarchaeota archaeon]